MNKSINQTNVLIVCIWFTCRLGIRGLHLFKSWKGCCRMSSNYRILNWYRYKKKKHIQYNGLSISISIFGFSWYGEFPRMMQFWYCKVHYIAWCIFGHHIFILSSSVSVSAVHKLGSWIASSRYGLQPCKSFKLQLYDRS